MKHNRLLCGSADGENLRQRPQRNRRGRLYLMAPSENSLQVKTQTDALSLGKI